MNVMVAGCCGLFAAWMVLIARTAWAGGGTLKRLETRHRWEAARVEMVFEVPSSATAFELQESEDLVGWRTWVSGPTRVEGRAVTNVTVRFSAEEGRRFYRMRTTADGETESDGGGGVVDFAERMKTVRCKFCGRELETK